MTKNSTFSFLTTIFNQRFNKRLVHEKFDPVSVIIYDVPEFLYLGHLVRYDGNLSWWQSKSRRCADRCCLRHPITGSDHCSFHHRADRRSLFLGPKDTGSITSCWCRLNVLPV